MLETIINYFKTHGINIVLIVAIAVIIHRFAMIIIKKIIIKAVKKEAHYSERDETLREKTLISTSNHLVRGLVWTVAGLSLLAELGIDIGPLLASAGIAGVALGFGAQSMVKDFLAGFFILAENHYRVGDVVKINQTVSGAVQSVTLRETVLRDLDGMVHHIPNGTIQIATNMTMEFSGINLDIGVGYDTDIQKLEKIINQECQKLAEDPDWKDQILEVPSFRRITEFGDSAINIKITGKTEAMKQWAVAGEIRKRLKIAFDKNGIQIPYPQRVVHQVNESKPTKKSTKSK